jgi:mannitol-1-phosphate 5-dehydrogenase
MESGDGSYSAILEGIRRTVRSRPRRLVMVGLGRLQLGLIGPVFSSLGYELVGVNLGSDSVVKRLRHHEYYRVIDHPPYGGTDVEVRAVHHYDCNRHTEEEDGSLAAVAEAAEAQIINTALGLSSAAVESAASFLLAVERYRRAHAIIDPLYITCSDNPIGSRFGIEFIQNRLQALSYQLEDEERIALWNDMAAHVRFLPCLADRICSARIVDEDNVMKPVHILAERYGELALGRSFLCVQPLTSKETQALGEIRIWDNLEVARQRKLYTLSMAHGIAAYIGAFDEKRPQTISQALRSRNVLAHVERALEEVATALAVQTGESETDWFEYASVALRRISNESLDDPISRVARDVGRKLSRADRLVGPLLLSLRVNFRPSESLQNAILHALLYAFAYGKQISEYEDDPETVEVGNQLRRNGARSVLKTVCGLAMSDPAELEIIDKIANKFERVVGA